MPAPVPPHALKIVLMQPQIAPNTGNIGRLCVATGAELHLVRPMGFVLSDKNLKRSGMDYWPRLKLTIHDDEASFLAAAGPAPRFWLFTTKSASPHWNADYHPDDWLIFGSETHGLSQRLLEQFSDRTLGIPQTPDERCLNLSTAVGIGLYEALRVVAW